MAIAARRPPELLGLVLVTPSPPSPEPITDEGRAKMLAMKRDRASAEQFLDGITAHPLKGIVRERAIADFIACLQEFIRTAKCSYVTFQRFSFDDLSSPIQ